MKDNEIRQSVRERYAEAAGKKTSCCGSGAGLNWANQQLANSFSKQIGYSEDDLQSVPDGANLGLGCGNPVALASLKEGEVVLDLGSGPGFDCFLAANKVGKSGKVIGVDMTPEMLEKARDNGAKGNYDNVEFRLGEIENLPVADKSIDAIISNCVINLSPDKERVFAEAYRVLKPRGRLMVSDMVLLENLPENIRQSARAYSHCIAGASLKDNYLKMIEKAGFKDVKIVGQISLPEDFGADDPIVQSLINDPALSAGWDKLRRILLSIKVHATK